MRKLVPGTPEQAGVSTDGVQRLRDLCTGWIADGSTPALIVLLARHGIIFLHQAWGQLGPEPGSPPVQLDSLFGIASVSKPVTAAAVMLLVERGLVVLSQPVQRYLPEFQSLGAEKITVRHLLTHTSGLLPHVDGTIAEIAQTGIARLPEQLLAYSNVAFDLLGEIVRRVSGQSFNTFVTQNIFVPLEMKDSSFIMADRPRQRSIQRHPGTPFDWADEVENSTRSCPSSTLWSTSMDMGIFAQTFLNRGSYNGFRLLHPETVAEMTRNQVPGIPREEIDGVASPSCGYSWFMLNEVHFPEYPTFPDHSYGHAGGSGSFLWVDPDHDLIGVYFLTLVHENVRHMDLFVNSLMQAVND
jgi:CubicO group peptidase (beta-lactamase class C family)